MGMYDYVRVKYPLPGKNAWKVQSEYFQTKDLRNTLFTYNVTEDGKLVLVKDMFSKDAYEEIPYKGPLFIIAMYGESFYEYKIEFMDGVVVEITEVEDYLE